MKDLKISSLLELYNKIKFDTAKAHQVWELYDRIEQIPEEDKIEFILAWLEYLSTIQLGKMFK